MSAIPAMLLGVLGSMATKLLSKRFFKWAIMWGAKRMVQATDTPHDDVWYNKVAEILEWEE